MRGGGLRGEGAREGGGREVKRDGGGREERERGKGGKVKVRNRGLFLHVTCTSNDIIAQLWLCFFVFFYIKFLCTSSTAGYTIAHKLIWVHPKQIQNHITEQKEQQQ